MQAVDDFAQDAGAMIFVCGRSHPMPSQVFDAFVEVLELNGMAKDAAAIRLRAMQRSLVRCARAIGCLQLKSMRCHMMSLCQMVLSENKAPPMDHQGLS
jgi:hypothetical protein